MLHICEFRFEFQNLFVLTHFINNYYSSNKFQIHEKKSFADMFRHDSCHHQFSALYPLSLFLNVICKNVTLV